MSWQSGPPGPAGGWGAPAGGGGGGWGASPAHGGGGGGWGAPASASPPPPQWGGGDAHVTVSHGGGGGGGGAAPPPQWGAGGGGGHSQQGGYDGHHHGAPPPGGYYPPPQAGGPPPPGGYYPPPGGQYQYGPPPGCCGGPTDPNAPGCCGPTNPQGGGMCCPADPTTHCVNTNPNEPGAFQTCLLYCDCTTWAVFFFAILSIVGFGVAIGTTPYDQLLAKYNVANSAALRIAMDKDIIRDRIQPRDNLSTTIFARRGENATECFLPSFSYSGTWGVLCTEDALEGNAMLLNLSRWVNFRGTLYFIAMCGTLSLLMLIYIVHRQKNPAPVYGQAPPTQPAPPIGFFATPMYYSFRVAWATVSIIIWFWLCNEMYQYWWFRSVYLKYTQGSLQEFWVRFDDKFQATVICVGIYLCWPLCELALQIAFFFAFFAPWCIVRNMCYPALLHPRVQTEQPPIDERSCCIRVDDFFMEFNQLKRVGLSDGIWRLFTGGSAEPFFNCGDFAPPPGYGGYPGAPPPQQPRDQGVPHHGPSGGWQPAPATHQHPSAPAAVDGGYAGAGGAPPSWQGGAAGPPPPGTYPPQQAVPGSWRGPATGGATLQPQASVPFSTSQSFAPEDSMRGDGGGGGDSSETPRKRHRSRSEHKSEHKSERKRERSESRRKDSTRGDGAASS